MTDRMTIDDLEPDGKIDDQTANWFRGTLLNAINTLDEADRDQRLRIKGRVYVLTDLFGLSDDDVIELAATYGQGEEMAEVLES